MRRRKSQLTQLRGAPNPKPFKPSSRETGVGRVLQIHPVPLVRDEILAIAIHLGDCFAAAQGKAAPVFSEDAAAFLAGRRWAINDLALRVSRAVASNQGSLITATDLDEAKEHDVR